MFDKYEPITGRFVRFHECILIIVGDNIDVTFCRIDEWVSFGTVSNQDIGWYLAFALRCLLQAFDQRSANSEPDGIFCRQG